MIITSSQQLEENHSPYDILNLEDFERITLKFGAFACIASGKKLNFINFLKLVVDDKRTQKLYFMLLGDDNYQEIVRTYLNCTPNVYKKIFRSKYNKK
jgi:hypothetical protein